MIFCADLYINGAKVIKKKLHLFLNRVLEPNEVAPITFVPPAAVVMLTGRLGLFLFKTGHRQPTPQISLVFQRGLVSLDSKTDYIWLNSVLVRLGTLTPTP